MSEIVRHPLDASVDYDPGEHVGDFEYADGSGTRAVHENVPEWVKIGDAEGWMWPLSGGSFSLKPVDPDDPLSTS